MGKTWLCVLCGIQSHVECPTLLWFLTLVFLLTVGLLTASGQAEAAQPSDLLALRRRGAVSPEKPGSGWRLSGIWLG